MSPFIVLSIVLAYFLVLIVISWITGRDQGNSAFYLGNRQSPWFVVAFGMIGATLSGVTFISIPGWVGESSFSYMQMVFGYVFGYYIIANVLMPLYYRMNLTTIYTYLEDRFGFYSYKTGAMFFLVSRLVGASLRVFLMAGVLQITVFDAWGIPFYATVLVTVLFIWLYTFRGGIGTIIWTDTLQTLFMLIAAGATVWTISGELGLGLRGVFGVIGESDWSRVFYFDDWRDGRFFLKQFVGGIFIAIVMTGLDQDMMQKNLSCKNIREARKNMYWFSITLVPVKLLLLCLGALLLIFATQTGIPLPDRADDIFPVIATQGYLPSFIGVFFIVGVVAATYSSADSTLTALTTSFILDILGRGRVTRPASVRNRKLVHALMALLLGGLIMVFRALNDQSVISAVLTLAGYTYGPLLGLYAFGIFTKIRVRDRLVPLVAILSPALTWLLDARSEQLFAGYRFGYEIVVVNGLIMFFGLWLLRRPSAG
ncbi:MAG: sodium:solute symporter [Marinilabiliales bacterium]|nr:MAG: sodium:solute symporter [Marinilabiliales bacterium]